ncbi:SAM-dependent methyltransferase [Nocardia heshunensis]
MNPLAPPVARPPVDDVPELPAFDPMRPQYARVHNYLLGGKDNFCADREFADELKVGIPTMPSNAWASRRFLLGTVKDCAEAGATQFVELGAGLPLCGIDQAVREVNPNARVLYVDFDPMVETHHRALTERENVRFLRADVRDTERMLAVARTGTADEWPMLNFAEPAVVSFCGLAEHLADPAAMIRTLSTTLAPGSLLVTTHLGGDAAPERLEFITRTYTGGRLDFHARSATRCGHCSTGAGASSTTSCSPRRARTSARQFARSPWSSSAADLRTNRSRSSTSSTAIRQEAGHSSRSNAGPPTAHSGGNPFEQR